MVATISPEERWRARTGGDSKRPIGERLGPEELHPDVIGLTGTSDGLAADDLHVVGHLSTIDGHAYRRYSADGHPTIRFKQTSGHTAVQQSYATLPGEDTQLVDQARIFWKGV
jgi:hypothetical protein